ncbi:MAG: DUF4254 domain-containing protein [Candidatus Tectimicrobiota bacterium]
MPEASLSLSPSLAGCLAQVHARVAEPLRSVVDMVPLYAQLTSLWAPQPAACLAVPGHTLPWALQLHRCNFRLWHTENGVRRPDAPAQFIAQSKRAIDTVNQQRHDQIEQLDSCLYTCLYISQNRSRPEAALHSETPGNLLDRLSILALKIHYMGHEASRQDSPESQRQLCRQRLAVLHEQRDDLYGCLGQLCLDLWSGDKIFKIYRQFKMYNDPALNPEIYRYRAPGEDAADGRL